MNDKGKFRKNTGTSRLHRVVYKADTGVHLEHCDIISRILKHLIKINEKKNKSRWRDYYVFFFCAIEWNVKFQNTKKLNLL